MAAVKDSWNTISTIIGIVLVFITFGIGWGTANEKIENLKCESANQKINIKKMEERNYSEHYNLSQDILSLSRDNTELKLMVIELIGFSDRKRAQVLREDLR